MPLSRELDRDRTVQHQVDVTYLLVFPHALEHGLDCVVMPMTTRLPIALGPEQLIVATMRDDVIDALRGTLDADRHAAQAVRIHVLERLRGHDPPAIITTVIRGNHVSYHMHTEHDAHARVRLRRSGNPYDVRQSASG